MKNQLSFSIEVFNTLLKYLSKYIWAYIRLITKTLSLIHFKN